VKKAWAWTKTHVKAVLGAVVGLLLFVLGAGWLWRRQKNRLGKVKDELAVAEAANEINRLRAVREEVVREVGEKDESIAALDLEIASNRQKIIEAHDVPENMSDEALLEELGRLGL
jgi:hypothetical protein